MESEMDVSRIDPETALVDAENVDAGELSIDNIDELDLKLADFGKEDKVLVSVRCVYGSIEKLLVSCMSTNMPIQCSAYE